MSDVSGALQEPWPDLAVQREGISLGIWVFLASEVLFFGVLIATYAVYRSFNAEAFRAAAQHTEILYGTISTVLPLTSSVTMTVALRASAARLRRLTLACLVVTLALGVAFLLVKGVEYRDDLRQGVFPGAGLGGHARVSVVVVEHLLTLVVPMVGFLLGRN